MNKPYLIGQLGHYNLLKTDDGSPTLYSSLFDENCHSLAGAMEETIHVYLNANEINEARFSSLNRPLRIFEVGFATGTGFLATKNLAQEVSGQLEFISSEIDPELAVFSLEKLKFQGHITHWQEVIQTNLSFLEASTPCKNKLIVLTGDVRKSLPQWKKNKSFKKFDCIFQDAFSPKKNPLLWTTEWFQELYGVAETTCTLTTYSSTKAVWKSMLEANWRVSTFPGYGKKRLSTRALIRGESEESVLEKCLLSPVEALRDRTYLKA